MHLTEVRTWEIIVSAADAPRRSFTLETGSLVLGTSPECSIVCTAAGIAPRHAEFFVNHDQLELRIIEGGSPLLLNGSPVHGLSILSCPATLSLGPLRISVRDSSDAPRLNPNPDSTLHLVHPAGPLSLHLTDPIAPDVTGRIVYRLPETGDAATIMAVSPGAEDSPLQSTAFSGESTMAFPMEPLDLAMDEKVPVRGVYSVKSEIARGGMGKIYSAADAELDRTIALKISLVGDRSKEPQFFREARLLALLEHPNIVPIHNLGVDSAGRPFYSMKLIRGKTLQSIIKQLAAGDAETAAIYKRPRLLDIFRKVCDAVAFAHAKGYLHRDLKPENIMVGQFGEVLVMDWGIAKKIQRFSAASEQEIPNKPEPETLPYIEGTPQYMSPEQANGMYGGLDERSDIYALGGILYAILTLRPPVSGSSIHEVLEKVRRGATTTMALPRGAVKTEAPSARSVPDALRAVTSMAMARDRENRYGSVEALESDVEAYLGGFATQAEAAGFVRTLILLVKRHRLTAALAALALVGAMGFTIRLAKSEKHAKSSERAAILAAARAKADATRAEENAERMRESEEKANNEREETRKAHAHTRIALAEAAEQAQNSSLILRVLKSVPQDLRDQQWDYLFNLADSSETTIEQTAASPWRRFQPHPKDPDLLFTLHEDGWIRTVHLVTGEMEAVVDTKWAGGQLAISPNADLAAISGFNRTTGVMRVKVIDLNAKTEVAGFDFPSKGQHPYFQFDRKSTVLLAYTTGPAQIYVLDINKGSLRWDPWKDQKNGSCSLSQDESSVVLRRVGEEPLEISLADGTLKEGTAKGALKAGNFAPDFLAYFSGGKNLLTLSGGILRMLETQSGKKLFDERLPNGAWISGRAHPSKLSSFPEDNLAVTLTQISDDSAAVLLHDGTDGKVTQTRFVKMDLNQGLDWQLIAHPLSKRISVARGNQIKTWSILQPAPKAGFTVLGSSRMHGFSFLNSPAKLITVQAVRAGGEGVESEAVFKIIDTKENRPEKRDDAFTVKIPEASAAAIYMTQNKGVTRLMTKYFGSDKLHIWNVEGGNLREPKAFAAPEPYWDLRFSPSGRLLWTSTGAVEVASGTHKPLKLEGTSNTSEQMAPVWMSEYRMAQIRMVPRDKTNPKGSYDRVILAWDIESGLQSKPELAPDALWLDASPDGTQLAESGADMRVRIRDAATLEVQRTLRVHDGPVAGVAWHPSLPLLATASTDFSVRIWNLETEQMEQEFRYLHNILPSRVMWSPDGRLLAISDTGTSPNVKVYEPKACQGSAR